MNRKTFYLTVADRIGVVGYVDEMGNMVPTVEKAAHYSSEEDAEIAAAHAIQLFNSKGQVVYVSDTQSDKDGE